MIRLMIESSTHYLILGRVQLHSTKKVVIYILGIQIHQANAH